MGRLTNVTLVLASLGMSAPAAASVYGDDLTRCLLKSAATEDREVLVRWVFSLLSVHPQVSQSASLTDKDRTTLHQEVAHLMERLIISDCRGERVNVIKYDGVDTLRDSFSFLGQTATQDLLTDPAVASEMGKFSSFLDTQKWEDLAKEAGVAQPPAPAIEKAK